jgi:hypothetical protein
MNYPQIIPFNNSTVYGLKTTNTNVDVINVNPFNSSPNFSITVEPGSGFCISSDDEGTIYYYDTRYGRLIAYDTVGYITKMFTNFSMGRNTFDIAGNIIYHSSQKYCEFTILNLDGWGGESPYLNVVLENGIKIEESVGRKKLEASLDNPLIVFGENPVYTQAKDYLDEFATVPNGTLKTLDITENLWKNYNGTPDARVLNGYLPTESGNTWDICGTVNPEYTGRSIATLAGEDVEIWKMNETSDKVVLDTLLTNDIYRIETTNRIVPPFFFTCEKDGGKFYERNQTIDSFTERSNNMPTSLIMDIRVDDAI